MRRERRLPASDEVRRLPRLRVGSSSPAPARRCLLAPRRPWRSRVTVGCERSAVRRHPGPLQHLL